MSKCKSVIPKMTIDNFDDKIDKIYKSGNNYR